MINKFKYFCVLAVFGLNISAASAVCEISGTTYTSCKPGYYLSGYISKSCILCPIAGKNAAGNDVRGTTVDRNTGGITSCKMPTGTYHDASGSFEILGDCPYSS